MTIDIGSETLGAAIVVALEKKGFAVKRECTKTGKLHELAFKTEAASKAEGIRLGIRKDSAGAVGAFIAETAEIALTKETAQTVSAVLEGGDVEIVAGTIYWLCVIPVKGTSLKTKGTEKAGFGFKTTAAVTKVSEGTWTTAENKWGEPLPIWGIEAAGGATGKLETSSKAVLIGGTETIGAKAAIASSTKIAKIGGTETISGKAGLSTAVNIAKIGGTETISGQAALATSASIIKIGGTQKLGALAALVTATKAVVIGGVQVITGISGVARRSKALAWLFDEEED